VPTIYDETIISDVMTTGPQTEFWCGSRKELNVSLHQLQGFVPPLSCLPQSYVLEITNIEGTGPYACLRLFNTSLPYGSFFGCA